MMLRIDGEGQKKANASWTDFHVNRRKMQKKNKLERVD